MDRYSKNRIKKLSYQSWHRGTRELDFILGNFADQYLSTFCEQELDEYQSILEKNDLDLWDWITGKVSIPIEHSSHILKKICEFYCTKQH